MRLFLGIITVALTASTAQAQIPCGTHAKMKAALAGPPYHETRFAHALAGNNLVEFYVNVVTRTWTVLGIMPNGTACISAAGKDFELDVPLKPETPET